MKASEAKEITNQVNNIDLVPIFEQIKAAASKGSNSTIFHLHGILAQNAKDIISRLKKEGFYVQREKTSNLDKIIVVW